MVEVVASIGKLMLVDSWAINIVFKDYVWQLTLPRLCEKTNPFPGAVLDLEEMKGLHKLLGEAINERENNLG